MKKSKLNRALLSIVVSSVFSIPALAITVDGKLDPLSNWDQTFNIDFLFDGGKEGTGFLALGTQTGGNQVLYYSVPKTFVDVSFGNTAIGWGSKNHNFSDLKGSDKLEFSTASGSAISLGFDGTIKSGGSIINSAATSLVYDANLSGDTVASYSGSDSPTLTGANPDYTDDSDANYLNSSDPDWIFDVAYEIEFNAGTFNNTDWSDGDLASLFDLLFYTNHKKVALVCSTALPSYDAATNTCITTITKGKHKGDQKIYTVGQSLGDVKPVFESYFGGHASPSKLAILSTEFQNCSTTGAGKGLCDGSTPPPPPGTVPVPGTVWLMILGFAGLYRARSKS